MRCIALVALVACRSSEPPKAAPKPVPVPEPPAEVGRPAKPPAEEIDPAAQAMLAGAVPGDEIRKLVPPKLAGVSIGQQLEYPWSAAVSYTLPEGGYANLDIQNTFHRGTHDTSMEDRNNSSPALCPKHEKVQGFDACVSVRPQADGGTSIRWYLPDRLTVRIAAPTEPLARKMAGELPIPALAKLSAQK
jgi:hypothetical protein